ncbi:MAG: zinc-binding dehydrogenase [Ilumatobacteraceae bacterium]
MVALVTTGVVRPRVAATVPLGEIQAAQAAFERKEHAGKIVITI